MTKTPTVRRNTTTASAILAAGLASASTAAAAAVTAAVKTAPKTDRLYASSLSGGLNAQGQPLNRLHGAAYVIKRQDGSLGAPGFRLKLNTVPLNKPLFLNPAKLAGADSMRMTVMENLPRVCKVLHARRYPLTVGGQPVLENGLQAYRTRFTEVGSATKFATGRGFILNLNAHSADGWYMILPPKVQASETDAGLSADETQAAVAVMSEVNPADIEAAMPNAAD